MAQNIEAAANEIQKPQQSINSPKCYQYCRNHSQNSCHFCSVICHVAEATTLPSSAGVDLKVNNNDRQKGHLHYVINDDRPPSGPPSEHGTSLNSVSKAENPPPELLSQ